MLFIDGRLLVALEGEPLVDVGAGEIVLFPRNDAHTLASERGIKPTPARQLIQPVPRRRSRSNLLWRWWYRDTHRVRVSSKRRNNQSADFDIA